MSEPDSSAAARCRWLRPTPPMVVWWYRHPCPLLEHFAQYYRRPRTPLAVRACLKPLGAIAEAHSRRAVVGDWALLTANDDRVAGNTRAQDLAFSTIEVTQAFGGLPQVLAACSACPANLPLGNLPAVSPHPTNPSRANPSLAPSGGLAGCSQWWMFGDLAALSRQTQELSSVPHPLPRPTWPAWSIEQQPSGLVRWQAELFAQADWRSQLPHGSPPAVWQAWWHPGQTRQTLSSQTLQRLAAALQAAADRDPATMTAVSAPDPTSPSPASPSESAEPLSGWAAFVRAVRAAAQRGDTLETEYVPAGFSDGHDWWLSPHCGRCGAGMASEQRQCSVCGRAGGPVPEQKRRIMGWAPYRPLSLLVDAATGQRLLHDLPPAGPGAC